MSSCTKSTALRLDHACDGRAVVTVSGARLLSSGACTGLATVGQACGSCPQAHHHDLVSPSPRAPT